MSSVPQQMHSVRTGKQRVAVAAAQQAALFNVLCAHVRPLSTSDATRIPAVAHVQMALRPELTAWSSGSMPKSPDSAARVMWTGGAHGAPMSCVRLLYMASMILPVKWNA